MHKSCLLIIVSVKNMAYQQNWPNKHRTEINKTSRQFAKSFLDKCD